ncbi:MAG: transglycosylase SLT domain-containing protein [Pyrinomonadaceae bacterium]
MASKSYTYDVRIRASLDTSKVSGAGSTVRQKAEQELNQAHEAGLRQREQKTKASLDLMANWERQHADKVKREQNDYTSWWGQELDKRDAKTRASLEKQGKDTRDALDRKKKADFEYTQWWEKTLNDRDRKLQQASKAELDRVEKKKKSDLEYTRWWEIQLDKRDKAERRHLDDVTKLRRKTVDLAVKTDDLVKRSEADVKALNAKTAAMERYNRLLERSNRTGSGKFTERGLFQASNEDFEKSSAAAGSRSASAFMRSFRGAVIGILTGMVIGEIFQIIQSTFATAVSMVQKGVELQQLRVGLTAVSTTATEASERVKILDKVARDTPGLLFENAVEGQMRLQAVGFSANEATTMLKGLSKVRILSNATDEDFRAVILNLTQIKSLGRLTGDEIRETLGRIPAMASVFRRAFGTVDINQIREMQLSSYEFFQKFNKALNEVQAPAESVSSAFIHLQNAWTKSSEVLAEPVLPELQQAFENLSDILTRNEDAFRSWGQTLASAIDLVDKLASAVDYLYNIQQPSAPGKASWLATLNPFASVPQKLGYTEEQIRTGRLDGSRDPRASSLSIDEQLANATTIEQKMRVLDEATRDAHERALSDLTVNLNKRRILVLQNAGFSRQQELNLQLELSKIERDGITLRREEEQADFERKLALTREGSEERQRLIEDHNRLVESMEKSSAAKLVEIDRKMFQDRIGLLQDYAEQWAMTLNSQYALDTATSRGSLQGADTSTPGRAAAVNAKTFEQQLADLDQQRRVLEGRRRIAKEGFIDDHGVFTPGRPQSDWLAIDKEYEAKMKELKAQELQLRAARNNQIASETRSLQQMMLRDGRLTISTGDPVKDRILVEAASKYNFSPNILAAQLIQESGGKRNAVSPKGAEGYFQFMPGTAKRFGVNPYDFKSAAEGAARYINLLLGMFGGDLDLALAGYNAGEGAVKKYGGIPPYKETRDYVRQIKARLAKAVNIDPSVSFGTFDVAGGSDNLTRERDEYDLISRVELTRRAGYAPSYDEMRAYHQIMVERARTSGKVQPTFADTAKGFAGLSRETEIGRSVAERPNYLLGIVDLLAKNEGDEKQLESDRSNFWAIATAKAKEYEISLERALEDVRQESELLSRRNVSLETTVEFEKQRNDLVRQTGDVERDLAVLAMQNSDERFVADRRALSAKREQLDLEREITELGDELANDGVNDILKLRVELMRQELDYRRESLNAAIDAAKAETDINRMLEVRTDVIYGKVMKHLGDQKNMTDAIADGLIGVYEGTAGALDKAIDRSTDRFGIFKSILGEPLKVYSRKILTDVTRGIGDLFGFGDLFNKSEEEKNPVMAGLKKQDRQIELLEQIARNTGGGSAAGIRPAQSFRIPGLGGLSLGLPSFGRIGTGATGGFSGVLRNLGSYANLFMSGGSASNSIPDAAGAAGQAVGAAVGSGARPSFLARLGQTLFGGGVGGGLVKGGIFGSLLSGAPFAGLSLGASLGSGSTFGSLLGGIGGAALGVSALAGLAPGVFGALAGGLGASAGLTASMFALFTNPITIAAAGALIPLAIILGINARRKQAEKQRSVLRNNVGAELDKLVSAVRGRRMSGADALAQAENLRLEYAKEVEKIKDSKTRRIAMNEWNPPNVLWRKMEDLKVAAEQSGFDDERQRRIIPEFADGGWVRARRGGTLARIGEAGHDEVVLSTDPSKWNQTAGLLAGFLGTMSPKVAAAAPAASAPAPIHVTINMTHTIDRDGMVSSAIESGDVERAMVKAINKAITNGEIKRN